MLKSVKIIAVLFVGIIFSGAAMAQSKVAVFNLQAAIMSTEAAKSKVNALKTSSEYSKLQSTAESIRGEVQKLAEDAQKNAVTWSDEQKAEHQRKMNFKRSDFETAVKKLRAMEAQVGQEIQKTMGPKAKTALEAIIKEQNLDLVLDANSAYFAGPNVDLTAAVVKRMNADK
ncbi:OmpH family outer membrane protein [Microbulbifer yueqingensis]|uniref:Periplasmic chaperone for outer membrane proteins Skp n=1 Tax=Microbulbifer yueqingensis TaxID=658219 RepID=A0A1G8UVJ0_9GAMM|nr:OmpH family outer membrane protein [Microbulbifer yueqingensis]SDJ57664.1 periplasmic chaperone for outer membrane proteins Skp [Microbulbifer yueqingensis]